MKWFFVIVILLFAGWRAVIFLMNKNAGNETSSGNDSLSTQQAKAAYLQKDSVVGYGQKDTIQKNPSPLPAGNINTKNIQPQQIADYAKTLIGVPYLYGSADPAKGFDCSGFITYVFNRFDITVPRSSIDFTNIGSDVSADNAREGDLILFTGTDSADHFVGHMGIVVSNTDTLRFIHSTSGKQYGVTITSLSSYYQKRYVKTVRVFN